MKYFLSFIIVLVGLGSQAQLATPSTGTGIGGKFITHATFDVSVLPYGAWPGYAYIETPTGLLKYYDGTAWQTVALGAPGTWQPADAQLTDIAGLSPTDNSVIIGDGTNFVLETGGTLHTSLGLAIGTNVQAYNATLAAVAASTYTGDDAIATVGTITSGVWNAGAVTSSGALTGASAVIGGGYGSTGATISDAGVFLCDGSITCTSSADTAYGNSLGLYKNRNGAVVQNGDAIGYMSWRPWDGDEYATTGQVRCVIDAAPGNDDLPTRMEFYTTPDGSKTSVLALTIQPDKTVYCADVCSAASFTDRTPCYSGDAIADLVKIKSTQDGKIDHASLPALAQKKIKAHRDTGQVDADGNSILVKVEEDGRDLGAMISFLTTVCQEQQTIIEDLTKRLEKLEKDTPK